jgi:hypothetical protein
MLELGRLGGVEQRSGESGAHSGALGAAVIVTPRGQPYRGEIKGDDDLGERSGEDAFEGCR